jgi:RimJ/RimL family protein N-acetyltransferase
MHPPGGAAPVAGTHHTQRLLVRPVVASHHAAYHRLHSDPRAHPYDADAQHTDLVHSQSRIGEIVQDWRRDQLGYWSVFAPEAGFIGVAGVRRSGYHDRTGRYRDTGTWNVYYRFLPEAWGRGYAAEVIGHGLIRCAELDPGAVVMANIRAGNRASVRVAEKLGMALSHEQCDFSGAPELVYVRTA